jgi:hypothetical protein
MTASFIFSNTVIWADGIMSNRRYLSMLHAKAIPVTVKAKGVRSGSQAIDIQSISHPGRQYSDKNGYDLTSIEVGKTKQVFDHLKCAEKEEEI